MIYTQKMVLPKNIRSRGSTLAPAEFPVFLLLSFLVSAFPGGWHLPVIRLRNGLACANLRLFDGDCRVLSGNLLAPWKNRLKLNEISQTNFGTRKGEEGGWEELCYQASDREKKERKKKKKEVHQQRLETHDCTL